MDLATFRALMAPAGQEALQAAQELAPRETDFLHHFEALNRRFPAVFARAALEVAILRREAVEKFPLAGRMFFTRPALEQASSHAVSTYRAGRFRGFERLVDLGCSIGGDTLALAGIAPTLGIDLDLLRLAMAKANLDAFGLSNQAAFIQADLNSSFPLALSPGTALFFDPARRSGERRVFSVHDYRPPLSLIKNWLPRCPALGVKISPGVKLEELQPYDAEVEFISLKGELKEAVLWFGPLKTVKYRATVLPGPYSFTTIPDMADSTRVIFEAPGLRRQLLPLSEPRSYLYEPDPAILRAGLVQELGIQLGAAQLDVDIAYLTSDQRVDTPFARVWAVEDWLPFNLKRLRAALHQRGVRQVVVKKRGSPLQPEELIQALRLERGDEKGNRAERVIFLTHLRGRPVVVICLP